MVKEFIVGKTYHIRPEILLYILKNNNNGFSTIIFEGRQTNYVPQKTALIQKPKLLCISIEKIYNSIRVTFNEDNMDWQFHPEDFELIEDIDLLIEQYNNYLSD